MRSDDFTEGPDERATRPSLPRDSRPDKHLEDMPRGRGRPEPAVRLVESHPPRPCALKHLQLVTQGQHLQPQDGARSRATSQGQQERKEDGHAR
jgi:hypothetical protein